MRLQAIDRGSRITNKRLWLFCASIIVAGFVGYYVWSVLSHSDFLKSDGSCVIVDGSRLRFSNFEIIVTNV